MGPTVINTIRFCQIVASLKDQAGKSHRTTATEKVLEDIEKNNKFITSVLPDVRDPSFLNTLIESPHSIAARQQREAVQEQIESQENIAHEEKMQSVRDSDASQMRHDESVDVAKGGNKIAIWALCVAILAVSLQGFSYWVDSGESSDHEQRIEGLENAIQKMKAQ